MSPVGALGVQTAGPRCRIKNGWRFPGLVVWPPLRHLGQKGVGRSESKHGLGASVLNGPPTFPPSCPFHPFRTGCSWCCGSMVLRPVRRGAARRYASLPGRFQWGMCTGSSGHCWPPGTLFVCRGPKGHQNCLRLPIRGVRSWLRCWFNWGCLMDEAEREVLRQHVNANCECGGCGPSDPKACAWCLMWHAVLAVNDTPAVGLLTYPLPDL
ncbi:hypothetical protein UFOVP1670_39 [uncultured Caudovirales phage]|uniref:Uncharacterized protein n=1 Tax=uncultured Caudovirales phage TaxID=2100421 RepID=A0A6J5T8D0_9CAUD|nr:hypothetical protein UFOVP1670_39 [uncultured Caudovirales phage]